MLGLIWWIEDTILTSVTDHCILKIGISTESIPDTAEDSHSIEMTNCRSVNMAIAEEFLEVQMI
jgi:hypothetical protein